MSVNNFFWKMNTNKIESNHFMDPEFCMMRSYSMAQLTFYLFVKILIFFKKDLESPLIFVLFLKGKTK